MIEQKSAQSMATSLLSLINNARTSSDNPVFIALDGRSGSGKSTLAAIVANSLAQSPVNQPVVTVIEGDQFYAGGSTEKWLSHSAQMNARTAMDWQRQYAVISELKTKGYAQWRAFDWHHRDWDTDTAPYCKRMSNCTVAPVVLLEGVYSARKELQALFDLRVLLKVPVEVCRAHIDAREAGTANRSLEPLWNDAEDHYFEHLLDRQTLDLILK